MCRPLLFLVGLLWVAPFSIARTSLAQLAGVPPDFKPGALSSTTHSRSILSEPESRLLPVSYANFSAAPLVSSLNDLVKSPTPEEILELSPVHTIVLRDEDGSPLTIPNLAHRPGFNVEGQQYISPDHVDRINKALGPNISSLGISPKNPTLPTVTSNSSVNVAGLDAWQAFDTYALPNIFSPQHMNFKMRLLSRTNVMVIQAVTLWMPDFDGALSSAQTSDWLPMFDLETGTRICVLNSTIVLKDCKLNTGFAVICFTSTSGAAFRSLYDTELEIERADNYGITCISSLRPEDDSEKVDYITRAATIGVPIAMIMCLLCVGLGFFYRHRAYRVKKDRQIAEMTSWKSKYLDLLQTNVSDVSGDSKQNPHDKNRAPPLMLEPLDGDADPKGLQQQLQMVLSGTDDAPISVQGELGRGAFGVVYKGTWKNMEVAIKTVLFQASTDLKNDPVIREACIALRVADEHLVATYHANVRHLDGKSAPVDGVPALSGNMGQACQLFLVQEFCDAGTLYQWLANSRLHPCNVPDKAVIVRCALDIALGIQALHASSIVHGDLKPQNVLLTSVRRAIASDKATKPAPPAWPYAAKLTDFGLSFRLDDMKSHLSNLHVGTPFYLAPEVQGSGYLSKAADMYSLGVLLWELYHGMPPYASSNGHLVNNQCFPRFNLRSRQDAPFSYAVLTLACLSKEHAERPTVDEAVAVLDDLNNSLNGSSPSASAYMRMTSLSRYTRGQSLQAPASMLTAGVMPPASLRQARGKAVAQGARMAQDGHDIAGLLMTMMHRTGLQLDKSLFKRLCNSEAGELQRLAGHGNPGDGMSHSDPAHADVRGHGDGGMFVHGGSPELFNLLPPASLANIAGAMQSPSRQGMRAGDSAGEMLGLRKH